MKGLFSVIGLTALGFVLTGNVYAVDLSKFEKELTTTGAQGEIHGASAAQGLFVLTYRNPNNYFDFIEMSLVSHRPEIVRKLEALKRHDLVKVKGSFLPNPSPQKHILVTSIEVVKAYQSGYETPAYDYEARLPDELLNKTNALFLVHAVHAEGSILVTEYKDAIVPVYVTKKELVQSLYRNDLVRLQFKVRSIPDYPTHLELDDTAAHPVEVVEAIKNKHGKPAQVEGKLILFPQAPGIMFNVFAVSEDLPEGLKRQYTLINFDSPEVFKKIREKLQAAWDRHPKDYVNGRNKLVSTAVRVRAKGMFNEVDPGQANAQILLDSPDAVEILE